MRIHLDANGTVAHVAGDPDRLQQVVWNLLSNAVKFTPRAGHVYIRLAHAGSGVELVPGDGSRERI